MTATTLTLTAGLDRPFAWSEGQSVRYLVADLVANGQNDLAQVIPAVNLALAIDVSGSMAGEKLAGAKRTAIAVANSLTPKDRLSIVAFDDDVKVLLDARPMDEAGRQEAATAIRRLELGGSTNLSGGWLQAAERVAVAQERDPAATHRILLLSDGRANAGITSRTDLARHAGELLSRGLITSCVGIGDGYDEELLGAMAEAGGGRLHDAAEADEIGEAVMGELSEGRATLVERATIRLSVPATMRAEVVGAWAQTALPGVLEVLVGNLLPSRTKRIVFRLHCPAGENGSTLLLGLSAGGSLPEGGGMIEADMVEVAVRLASEAQNNSQPRDVDRSLAALVAWQSDVLRRVVGMNREGDHDSTAAFMDRQRSYMKRYASGLPGADAILAELEIARRHADEGWSERTRKGIFASMSERARADVSYRISAPTDFSEHFQPRRRR